MKQKMLRKNALSFICATLTLLPVATSAVKCSQLKVKAKAVEKQLPWSDKEHYIKFGEVKPSSISCRLRVSTPDLTRNTEFDLPGLIVEWLFYPEYTNLDKLEIEYDNIHGKNLPSQLQEPPCRFPVSNQDPAIPYDMKVPICKDKNVRSVSAVVVVDDLGDDGDNDDDVDDGQTPFRYYTSLLTFNKAAVSHTGTYQCRWRWSTESGCQVVRSPTSVETGRTETASGGRPVKQEVVEHLPGHSPHRSDTIYVKVYREKAYFEDIATIVIASSSLLIVLVVMWCLDSNLRKISIQYEPAEHV